MQGTVHLLVGAAIASLVPHQPTMVILAFFSHYVLDLLPHIDPETFADAKMPYTLRQKMSLVVDVVLVIALLSALYLLRSEPFPYLVGAVAAQLPDLMIPLEQYEIFAPLKKVHYMLHWREERAQAWSWYIAGLAFPSAIAGVSLLILLTM